MARWKLPVSLALALTGATLSFVGCSRQGTPAAYPTDDATGVRRDVDRPSPPTRTARPTPTVEPSEEPSEEPSAAPGGSPAPASAEPPASDAAGSPAALPSPVATGGALPTPAPSSFPFPGGPLTQPGGVQGGTGAFAPRFVEDVTPILLQHCAKCHTPAGPGTVPMFDAAGTPQYQVIHDNIGRIMNAIDSGKMPAGGPPLPQAKVAMLRAWQAVGAPPEPDATPSPGLPGEPTPKPLPTATPAPTIRTISFNNNVVPILENRCASCHSFSGTGSGAVLMFGATHRAVPNQIGPHALDIIDSIEKGRMPPNAPPGTVTADELNTLKLWVAAGAPFN